ncbi:hypothetical protein C8Q76DRAFT_726810 [Earliella scabrosa]|nr:hypothetical protein C8Q76DRAFT_726810 [Earliella scabrosa]
MSQPESASSMSTTLSMPASRSSSSVLYTPYPTVPASQSSSTPLPTSLSPSPPYHPNSPGSSSAQIPTASTSASSSGSTSDAPRTSMNLTSGTRSSSDISHSTTTMSTSNPAQSTDAVRRAVGGTIGGIASLIIAGSAIFLIYLRRRRSRTSGPEQTTATVEAGVGDRDSGGIWERSTKTVLYNPDDPTTFPSVPSPRPNRRWTGGSLSEVASADGIGQGISTDDPKLGGYAGKAEIQ